MKEFVNCKIILHIGLCKTATTSLQDNVFMKLHQQGKINFLGRANKSQNLGDLRNIYNPFKIAYDQSDSLDSFKIAFEKLLDFDKVNVISEESLSTTDHAAYNLYREKTLKLLSNYTNVQILVSLRQPVEYIYSFYVEWYKWRYFRQIHRNSLRKFIKHFQRNIKASRYEMFFYPKILEKFNRPQHEIRVLYFEDLKYDPKNYFTQLAELLNSDSNVIEKMFNLKRENVKKKSLKGLYSEKISLERLLGWFIRRSIGCFSVKLENKLLERLMKIPFLPERLHPYLNKQEKQMLNQLLCKKNFELNNYNISIQKCQKYGYLLDEKTNIHSHATRQKN